MDLRLITTLVSGAVAGSAFFYFLIRKYDENQDDGEVVNKNNYNKKGKKQTLLKIDPIFTQTEETLNTRPRDRLQKEAKNESPVPEKQNLTQMLKNQANNKKQ